MNEALERGATSVNPETRKAADHLYEIGVNTFFTAVAQPLDTVSLGSGGGSPGGARRRSSADVFMCSYMDRS